MRQSQRHARQERRADVPASAGDVIDIRELTDDDVDRIGSSLPLARLGGKQTYFVGWDGDEPVAQACVAWSGTKLGVPEVQDVFVRNDRRGRGIGERLMRALEGVIAGRGHRQVSISYGVENAVAKALYEKLGYRNAGIPPQRVRGTILIRSGPLEVDDTLIYLVKELPVDSGESRSS